MKVIQARALGMCFGVRDALATARQIERPAEVTIFGQLVHNPQVQRELAGRGFASADESRRDAHDVQTRAVLVTAHGISDRERSRLVEAGKQIIDTTCPLVRRAHAAALALGDAGYFVVVVGIPGHVEVLGLSGDLANFDVVEPGGGMGGGGEMAARGGVGERDGAGGARQWKRYAADRIGIIAQTTTPLTQAEQAVRGIRDANPQASVRFINTICRPTRDRQAAVDEVLREADILVVVGGRHSNNTRQLMARAADAGVPALLVEEAGELVPEMFRPGMCVGLTAGTSTPGETVAAVRRRLEEIHAGGVPTALFPTNSR